MYNPFLKLSGSNIHPSDHVINFNNGFYDKISAGYDYSVGVKTSTPPFTVENLDNNWPFNDLYFKGCEVVLEPCFYEYKLPLVIKKRLNN